MIRVPVDNKVFIIRFYRYRQKSVYCQLFEGTPDQKYYDMEIQHRGLSRCNKKEDRFSPILGQKIALLRALKEGGYSHRIKSLVMRGYSDVMQENINSPVISEALYGHKNVGWLNCNKNKISKYLSY